MSRKDGKMDKFILEVKPQADISMVVKLDSEAAALIYKLQILSGADKKHIVSEMVKFCYPRCEIRRAEIKIGDEEKNEIFKQKL